MLAALCVAGSLLLGCGEKLDSPRSADGRQADPGTQGQDARDAHAPGEAFEVIVEAPTGARAGREALAKVRVEPRSPWHMNTGFPVALRIPPVSDVEIDAGEQGGADAERFDDDALIFALPFTPKTKGMKRIAGEVAFAVCGDAACAPETVAVDFTVDVGCDSDALC